MRNDNLSKRVDIRFFRLLEKIAVYYRRKCYESRERKDNKKWESLFDNQQSFVFKLDEQTRINLYRDSILSRVMYDGFEENETAFLKKYLCSGDTFLDVGANVGLFSLLASAVVGDTGQIHAFEPTPETYRRLKENIALNSFRNIVPHQIGLSDSEGELSFNISENGFDAWNSFARLDRLKDGQTISVKTTTIDDFIRENNILTSNIKLIKIDVEGWEMNVLKGATHFLSHSENAVLMVEYTESNAFAAGYYCGEIYDFVEKFGFSWFRYSADTNQLVPEVKKMHYPYDNLLAIKDIDRVREIINQ